MRHLQQDNGRDVPKEDYWELCKGRQRKAAPCLQRMPEEIFDKRRNGEKPVTIDKTKKIPLPLDLKLGIVSAIATWGLISFGAYLLVPKSRDYKDKGNGYSIDYHTKGKDVSVELKLEKTLDAEAAKLSGLAVRVQETGQTAPLTKKDDAYFAALNPPESYTLLVYGKGSDGKEIPVTTLRFPPAKYCLYTVYLTIKIYMPP